MASEKSELVEFMQNPVLSKHQKLCAFTIMYVAMNMKCSHEYVYTCCWF